MRMKRFFLSAVFATGSLLVTPVAGSAASLPGGAGTLLETYEDWAVACRAQSSVVGCVVRHAQSGEEFIAAELRNLPDGRMDGALLLPFGLALAQGVSMKIDESGALPSLVFSTCIPGGCVVPVKFDAANVTKLKSGTVLNVSATSQSSGETLPLKVSLKGLAKASSRAAELMK
jgi:invasion protein IalB